ncbi:hypothetical protein FQN54_003075 [Arachnomyces sp. PD_36]|nr:hypothetical protein FQN54_003075 [Arachnomyces sp. PD_36]
MVRELDAVNGVQRIIGYNFNDTRILWLALQAAGSGVGGNDGNKVRAMQGDAVLQLVIIDILSAAGHSRGSISDAKTSIASNNNLAERCTATGLTQFINVNPSQRNADAPKTRAATVEAVIGAVYTDSGRNMAVVEQVMHALGLDAPSADG